LDSKFYRIDSLLLEATLQDVASVTVLMLF